MADETTCDKRRARRTKCLIEGRADFPDRIRTRSVMVRNLSDEGATLECERATELPERFTLVLPFRKLRVAATTRWRQGGRAGVRLEGDR
jgi:hypothetical protein